MSITKEQLRSLIREQMSNVSEVADEYTPMMPPKPVKPKGIAGTDLPMSALSDGIDAVIKKLEDMYAPSSREYKNVMNVLNIINNQEGLPESDVEEGLTRAQADKAWEEMNQARRDREAREKGLPADDSIDITDKPNQVKVTKEHLQRIIQEEIKEALEDGYRGTRYPFTPRGQESRAHRQKQVEYSNAMIKKGREDALEGKSKDKNIVHLGYHQAYNDALKQKSSPVQEQ